MAWNVFEEALTSLHDILRVLLSSTKVEDIPDDADGDGTESCSHHMIVLHVEVLEDLQRQNTVGFVGWFPR